MAAFLISLIFVVMLIVGGVFVNIYLYSRGAFSSVGQFYPARRLGTVTMRQEAEAIAEEQFYMSIGRSDNILSSYVRRGVVIFLGIIIALSMILALFVNGAR